VRACVRIGEELLPIAVISRHKMNTAYRVDSVFDELRTKYPR